MTQGASNAPHNTRSMTKKQLIETAEEMGVDVDASDTKAQILEKIDEAEA